MNIANVLLGLAPTLISALTAQGIQTDHATTAVHAAISTAATEHDKAQDARLVAIESRLTALETEGA